MFIVQITDVHGIHHDLRSGRSVPKSIPQNILNYITYGSSLERVRIRKSVTSSATASHHGDRYQDLSEIFIGRPDPAWFLLRF